MENENDLSVDETTEEQVETKEPEKEPEKPKLTLEQQRGILKRKLTKINKELGISEEEPEKEEKKEVKDELDYGQLAYLETRGVTTDEEIDFVKGVMKRSGEDLKTVLKNEFVQNKLKSMKDSQAVLDATPSGTKSGSPSVAKDTVEYWLAKGGLPKDNPALATKVVNARIERDKNGAKFYNS